MGMNIVLVNWDLTIRHVFFCNFAVCAQNMIYNKKQLDAISKYFYIPEDKPLIEKERFGNLVYSL